MKKTIESFLRMFAVVGVALLFTVFVAGCAKEEGPMEKAGKKIDQAVETAKEKVDETAKEVKEGADKTKEAVKDAVKK